MFALELPPPRHHGGAFCLDVPDTVVPTQMLCNGEAMARSTWWYMCNEYALLFLPMLLRAILMISNLHIHDMIRPVQPAAGYDSSQPHSSLSPNAMESYINDISQYTRGDTPCTTCSRLRFISNLTPCSLQTLWRAILMISYRNIHEVIRPVKPAAGYDSSRTSLISLSRHYGGQYYWYHIAIYTWWYALYNLQPATIPLKPHFLFSPDAMEGNIKYIILQYTRGDTPCTTCSRLWFISNLTYFSLQTLWRAILSISYCNIYEVIPCTTYSQWGFISNLTHCSLQTLWRAILSISYRNIHEVIRPVQPAAGYDSSQTSLTLSSPPGGANRDTVRRPIW